MSNSEKQNPTADELARRVERAKECYGMSKTWAFFEALMFNNGNYRTHQGRLQIKDACFNDIAAPVTRAGVPKEEIERIRTKARDR